MDGVVREQGRQDDKERLHDENDDKQAGDLAQRLAPGGVTWRGARSRRFARILAPAT